eukprot:CAMPEP_0168773404 /NCGR_PEP_ID=MMETSP0725-20121227/4455_1 /TAXON_ID=265536 /ORGANISM="Amphiprora sp., Strain CCMP467" /LENGTH=220 /DNA_ID=CAMNT_0008822953 /DNA_START=37 /DNA_END=699 /DNA_ORIENTATION=-
MTSQVDHILFLEVDDNLFKTCFGTDNEWSCRLTSLSESSTSAQVAEALADVDGTHMSLVRNYYRQGGWVVFFGIYGDFAAPQQLGNLFGVDWRFSAYTKYEYVLTTAGKELLGDAITQQQYTKANLLSVPEEERILVPKPYWESVEKYKEEECDSDDDDEETIRQNYQSHKDGLSRQVPLAVHTAQQGGGRIAYLGFVNGDGNIPQLVRALCTRSKTSLG